MNPQVSIIIVNYNSEKYLVDCIDSIKNYTKDITYEILVVDNASEPDSVNFIRQHYLEVRLIINDKNLGFGAANNCGAKVAKGDYLFFLNPDTILLDDAVSKFYHFLEGKNNVVACGGNLIAASGKNQTSFGNFPSLLQEIGDAGFKRFYRSYYNRNLSIGNVVKDHKEPFQVDYVVGADVFVKKDVFYETEGFDERFFLYYEETDLFYRLYKKGYDSYILPEVKIVHIEGTALMENMTINLWKWSVWEKSKYYYFKKHKGVFMMLIAKVIQLISLVFHYFFGPMKYPLIKTLKITWKA